MPPESLRSTLAAPLDHLWPDPRGPRWPNDVTARVQTSGLDELGRLVVFRIQVLDGVTRTLTCMVIQR